MGAAAQTTALLSDLRDLLGARRIQQGFRTLDSLRPSFEALAPGPGAGVLTGLLAQWVDAGFDRPELLQRLLDRFPRESRPALPLLDYLHLRMAEGVLLLAREEFDEAAGCLRAVLSFEREVADPEMFAIANFWVGRCLRKRGRYDQALAYAEKAETLALACGYAGMAAIVQVTLSWLKFQTGRLHEATAILRRAELALEATDDFLNRGNVQSAYGRIARRQGKYDVAIGRFERAIGEFRTPPGAPLQLARTLVNLAFVKRLLAVRLDRSGPMDKERRARIGEIRAEAKACLAEATQI
jgi:tetratricopeptide (TPR) repeat protein